MPKHESISLEGRFDLAYNAAHALSLAALRWHSYRAQHRYIVFQVLPHTLAELCHFSGYLPPKIDFFCPGSRMISGKSHQK